MTVKQSSDPGHHSRKVVGRSLPRRWKIFPKLHCQTTCDQYLVKRRQVPWATEKPQAIEYVAQGVEKSAAWPVYG